MAKFTFTYGVYYSTEIEVDADNLEDAEIKAQEIGENLNPTKDMDFGNDNLDLVSEE